MRIVVDYSQTPQDIDDMGNITQSGSRVRDITLSDGTKIVENGALAPGAPSVSIATADFTARGGDQFPFNNAPFTRLGLTYDLVLSNYVQDELGGIIDVLAYPGGGENRIIGLGEPLPEAFCLADFDHSISRNMEDVMIFLDLVAIGSPAADLDANGRFNYGDVVEFLNLYATTCPAETPAP